MNQEQSLIGALLKLERMKQNRSQKEVCFGICVPSYLSKIEYGSVKPDEEILSKLFQRLGIVYVGQGQKLSQLEMKVKDYFERLEYKLDKDPLYQELLQEDSTLSYSCLAIDWLIIKREQGEDVETYLKQLQPNMTVLQNAYYEILKWEIYPAKRERVAIYEEAAKVIDSSFAMNLLCLMYFQVGDYNKIHQLESKIVAMALEEGNTYQLAEFYFMNGSAYACLNMEEMMVDNINRSVRLLQNTGWKGKLRDQYYNLGATYISLEKYDLAKEYLLKTESCGNDFMVHQKLALAYIRSGDITIGKEYLEKMKTEIPESTRDEKLFSLLIQEVQWECCENFLDDPSYLELLEQLMAEMKEARPFSYLYFFQDVIVQAYTRQRKYKKALGFQRKISQKIKNT